MDLYNHDQASFTRWIVDEGFLHDPFIVIDVGVQGGEHPRWAQLGDQVRVYGFDAISEAIDRIRAERGDRPHRVFRAMAIGDEDGTREFYVPANTFSASFFRPATDPGNRHGDGAVGARTIPIRRLDSLYAEGVIPPADYIKIDCEGFDPEVLRGGRTYLAKSNVLCVTVETGFAVSPTYPRTAFAEINDIVVQHRLLVFDLNCVRSARPSYVAARARHPWPPADPMHDTPGLDVGQPGTFDFVFCRDFVAEDVSPQAFATFSGAQTEPTVDKIIKSMINFELHGLMDCAVDLAEHFRPLLGERLDVDQAIVLLTRRPPHARNTADVVECLRMIAALRQRVAASEQVHARNSARADRVAAEAARAAAEADRTAAQADRTAAQADRAAAQADRATAQADRATAEAARAAAQAPELLLSGISKRELAIELGHRVRRRIGRLFSSPANARS